MRILGSLISLSIVAVVANSLKVGVLSDVHVNPYYDPTIDGQTYCQSKFPVMDLTPVHSTDYAPLGRIICDPPQLLLESLLKKINQSEPDLDVLMLTGDFIGHSIPIEPNDPDNPELYEVLKQVHNQIAQLIANYLPNVVFLPTLGNNDYKYHYQAPYDSNKEEYYSFMFTQWFLNQPTNSKLSNLDSIKQTFMNGGYYRVDLSPKISFLGLNTLMYNKKNEPSQQGHQQDDQFAWIEEQLKTAEPQRKFILSNHIYPGAKIEINTKKLWHSNYTVEMISIMQAYHDKILLEVSGHDHISDLRYNLGSHPNVSLLGHKHHKKLDDYNFHNLLIAPGVTSASEQNPGYTIFNLDDTIQPIANNLRMVFLQIEKTYNWQTIPSDFSVWPFLNVDFTTQFGVKDLSPDSLNELKKRLAQDKEFVFEYLAYKIGYNPKNADELQKSMNVHNEIGLITQDLKTYIYLCQMYQSMTKEDLDQCLQNNMPQTYRSKFHNKFLRLSLKK